MYNNRKLVISIFWIIIGVALMVMSFMGYYDSSTFDGLGGALIAVGIVQIVRHFRYRNDEAYREKVDVAISDERYRLIRMKAWSIAGYLMAIGLFVVGIGTNIAGYQTVSNILVACGGILCAMYILVLFILNKIN